MRTSALDRARDHAHGGRDISGPGRDHCGHAGSFVLAYGVVFWFGIYYINRLIAQGPRQDASETRQFSSRPISAAQDAGREAMQR